jgi:hypothetical protein
MISSLFGVPATDAQAAAEGWIDLTGLPSFDAWKPATGAWGFVSDVHLDPENPKRPVAELGTGALYNGPAGRTDHLVTREQFGNAEFHVEFLIPKGSNSGVKFGCVYEIQIFDSYNRKEVK